MGELGVEEARESIGTELCAAAALGDIELLKSYLADGASVRLHVEIGSPLAQSVCARVRCCST